MEHSHTIELADWTRLLTKEIARVQHFPKGSSHKDIVEYAILRSARESLGEEMVTKLLTGYWKQRMTKRWRGGVLTCVDCD